MPKIEVFSPFDGDYVGSFKDLSEKDVLIRVDKLSTYNKDLTEHEIHQCLKNLETLVKLNKKKFSRLITKEIGICIQDSEHEVDRSIEVIKLSSEECIRINGYSSPSKIGSFNDFQLIHSFREPLGIIGCITPFNHPLNQVVHKVCPALAANNAVLLKPSAKSSITANFFADLVYEAGFPENMFQIVTGSSEMIGEIISKSSLIDMISFTGSHETSLKITRSAGVKKLFLELGGSSVMLVCNDADIDLAVKVAINGCFKNSGQRCTAIRRIITLPDIHVAFMEKFTSAARKIKCGNPFNEQTDMGTVISSEYSKEIEKRVSLAIEDGAFLKLGGVSKGAFFPPTVLENVNPLSILTSVETFGPVAPVICAKNFDDAIYITNETSYGLSSSIITNSLNNIFEFSSRVKVGGVRVNMPPGMRNEYLPFGGVKDSGYGRSGVRHSIEEMTYLKTLII